MRLKKSAILLILLSLGSVILLVFSSAIDPETAIEPVMPLNGVPVKSCVQVNEVQALSSWELISPIIWKSET